jgi:hypothetical protein
MQPCRTLSWCQAYAGPSRDGTVDRTTDLSCSSDHLGSGKLLGDGGAMSSCQIVYTILGSFCMNCVKLLSFVALVIEQGRLGTEVGPKLENVYGSRSSTPWRSALIVPHQGGRMLQAQKDVLMCGVHDHGHGRGALCRSCGATPLAADAAGLDTRGVRHTPWPLRIMGEEMDEAPARRPLG